MILELLPSLDAYTELLDPLWTRSPRAVVDSIEPGSPTVTVRLRTNRAARPTIGLRRVRVGVDVAGVRSYRTFLAASSDDDTSGVLTLSVRANDHDPVALRLTDPASVGLVVHLGAETAPPTARTTTSPPGTRAAGQTAVTFARSGVTAAIDAPRGTTAAPTLLAVAEANDVVVPTGCRRGVCHTCTTHLVAGHVTDGRDGRTIEPGGFVQLCVTNAADSEVILDV